MQAIHTLRMALMNRFSEWSPEEQARVRQILEKAARDIASGTEPKG
jgi:hypothetical protein